MQESDNTFPERPSKSQRKREVLALQKIGETLVDLPAAELAKSPPKPIMSDAIYFDRTLIPLLSLYLLFPFSDQTWSRKHDPRWWSLHQNHDVRFYNDEDGDCARALSSI